MPSSVPTSGDLVLLDACCLINLFATGRAGEILQALPYSFAVARYVAEEEVLEIEQEGAEEVQLGSPEPGRITLRPRIARLIEKGLLEKLDISSADDSRELVRFAAQLDDGEAHTLALALVRGGRVATDDRKAIRVARQAWGEASGLAGHLAPCIRTSELLFEWAERHAVAEADLERILQAVAQRASFLPPSTDPHFERWMTLIAPTTATSTARPRDRPQTTGRGS